MADLATVHRHPGSWRFAILVGSPVFLAIAGALIYLAWSDGAYVPVAILAVGAVGLLLETRVLVRLARVVETSQSGIRARTYLGLTRSLRWEEITVAERFPFIAHDRSGTPTAYRLASSRGHGIFFTSRIDRVDELLAEIGRHVALERFTKPPWWRRLL